MRPRFPLPLALAILLAPGCDYREALVGADADADGYGSWVDCDDADATVNPGATETPYDGVDGDCDPATPDDDLDADGFAVEVDCDDADPWANPDAIEACNGRDDDCDGLVDEEVGWPWYEDVDGDGFGDPDSVKTSCDGGPGWVANDLDCDDALADVNPGGLELCDGIDGDCDGTVDDDPVFVPTWYADADDDGFGDPDSAVTSCVQPANTVSNPDDCDDASALVHPGADETCDATDRDCDGDPWQGAIDAPTVYLDADADTFGDEDYPLTACSPPGWYVGDDQDCDDENFLINPLADETCNARDDDCDGQIDEDPSDWTLWYQDLDGDGYGTEAADVWACTRPEGYAAGADDCDDTSPGSETAHPGGVEVCDTLDNDCDDTVDEDAIDQRTWYADTDGDGWGDETSSVIACDEPEESSLVPGDCDDTEPTAFPGATEHCTALDEDCDGSGTFGAVEEAPWYADGDGDGFGAPEDSVLACEAPVGFVADATDCDDGSDAIHVGADESCNGVDDDCDTEIDEEPFDAVTWFTDADGDGFGDPLSLAIVACEAPPDRVEDDGDCDDSPNGGASIHPGAVEVCDGVDNDCNGTTDDAPGATLWYADTDGDGFGDPADVLFDCDQPIGYVAVGGDCDDTSDGSEAIHPDATEICDLLDNDCDGIADDGIAETTTWYLDADKDGYGRDDESIDACFDPGLDWSETSGDCDDNDPEVHPNVQGCDGRDLDCVPGIDGDGDGDGYADVTCGGDDCDDGNGALYPGAGCPMGRSCLEAMQRYGLTTDGNVLLDPDGFNGPRPPLTLLCDMTADANHPWGGWTQVINIGFSNAADATGWYYWNGSVTASVATAQCGGFGWVLGGYNQTAYGTVYKLLDLQGIPHEFISANFRFLHIDSWDGEGASLQIGSGGEVPWYQTFTNSGTNECGNPSQSGWLEDETDVAHRMVWLPDDTFYFYVSTSLNQSAGDESFAIDNVVIWVR